MVENYSTRNLSRPKDKLPAFSGIASHFAKLLSQDEDPSPKTRKSEYSTNPAQSLATLLDRRRPLRYLGGLWQEDFLQGLLWHCSKPSSPIPYRGPTWSWVSCESNIYYNHHRLRTDNFYTQVLDVSVTVRGKNPWGRLSSGKVTLLGPAAPLPSSAYKDESGTQFEIHRHRSFDWDLEGAPQLGCILLKVHEQRYLILAPEARCHAGIYRRVGLISHESTNLVIQGLDWQEEVITII